MPSAEHFRLRWATSFATRGGSMRRAPLVGFALLFAGAVIIAQQVAAPTARDPQRELMMSVADGFTLAAVGDCIIARPCAQATCFAAGGKNIHDGGAAVGNFEGTAIDLTRTPAVRRRSSAASGSSARR